MHDYRAPLHPRQTDLSSAIPPSAIPTSTSVSGSRPSRNKGKRRAAEEDDDEDDDNDERFPGEAEDGYSYDPKAPLVTKTDESNVVFDGDEELHDSQQQQQQQQPNGQGPDDETVHVPYAHRDLKPG